MQPISSRENAVLKHLHRLAHTNQARRRVRETLLEGAHLIEAALQAGIPLKAFLVLEGAEQRPEIAALLEAAKQTSVTCYGLPGNLFAHISPVETPSGVMAWIAWPESPALAQVSRSNLLVLNAIQDPGNLGTLLRTAAAAGISTIWLTPGCAQIWSPKVLRAGMGAHFSLQLLEDVDAVAALENFPGAILATVLDDTAKDLYDIDLRHPVAWLFGAEGQGLAPELSACATQRVRIPMPGGVESLNVSAAAAICLFEQVRQTRQKT